MNATSGRSSKAIFGFSPFMVPILGVSWNESIKTAYRGGSDNIYFYFALLPVIFNVTPYVRRAKLRQQIKQKLLKVSRY